MYAWGIHNAARHATLTRFNSFGAEDQEFASQANRRDVLAVWRAVLREFWLPLLLALTLLLAEGSVFLRAGDWLPLRGSQGTLMLPAKATIAAAILATLRTFWTRRRLRIAHCALQCDCL